MSISSWFSKMLGADMTLDNLQNVLLLQLRRPGEAEEQLIEALPKMADAAANHELRSAFQTHLVETRQHKARLEEMFRLLHKEPGSETCEAMEGLIAEGEQIIGLAGDPEVKDAALIAAAQRVEHYEMAGYGCAGLLPAGWGTTTSQRCCKIPSKKRPTPTKFCLTLPKSPVNADAARA